MCICALRVNTYIYIQFVYVCQCLWKTCRHAMEIFIERVSREKGLSKYFFLFFFSFWITTRVE